MRQAENRVRIEGIVSEIDIHETSFKRDGETKDAIGGQITIRVKQEINGKDLVLEVPVQCFATKLTRKGTPNPAYDSIQKATDLISIAACGNEEEADCIRITNGDLKMNEYYGQSGNLISFPRVHSSFFQKVRKDELKPEATFICQFMVTNKAEELDRNGDPTGRYIITGALPQYGDAVDVFKFYCESEGVINAVSSYWEVGDTVQAHGKLKFTSTTESITEESGFGDAIVRERTISVSEPIITGGSQDPLVEELCYTNEEIKEGLARRKAKLEGLKNRNKTVASAKAPKQDADFSDLGF